MVSEDVAMLTSVTEPTFQVSEFVMFWTPFVLYWDGFELTESGMVNSMDKQ